jgi:hypothetical protein
MALGRVSNIPRILSIYLKEFYEKVRFPNMTRLIEAS